MTDKKSVLVAEVNVCELTCRIMEAVVDIRRPPNLNAREALDGIDPAVRMRFIRAADAVVEYLQECVDLGKRMQ